MVSESTTPQRNIDLLQLKKLREEGINKKTLEDRTRYNNFIESERAKVRALIPTLPQKLEEAARKGQSDCEVLFLNNVRRKMTKEELMQHPAYGELIRYLESQGLTDVTTGGIYHGEEEEGGLGIYVALP